MLVRHASNALVWDGRPGHYEVHYLTLTDPLTGVGCWIRYTLLAPSVTRDRPPTAAVWFLAMDPRAGHIPRFALKRTYPIERLRAGTDPFELRIADATLTDTAMAGALDGAAWDLRFEPSVRSYVHVHPLLQAARAAQTVLTLPQADLLVSGTVSFGSERIELSGARGGQAHLWGSKHARRWAWVHCNDFTHEDGSPAAGTILDGVSVVVSRGGTEVGPSTPVVGRIDGEDFISTSLVRVLTNPSAFALTGWRFEATAGSRRVIGEVDADRSQLIGVTYSDPDGEPAYCYNSETATLRLQVLHRARRAGGWLSTERLVARGRAHFEYAQRTPVPNLELLI